MKTCKTILSITLLASAISSPLMANENRQNIAPPLEIEAFFELGNSSRNVSILSQLELAETKGEYASLVAILPGFDWYGDGRREAHRAFFPSGSCLNCGFGNVSSH